MLAPAARYGHSSHTAASNPRPARWLARSAELTANACTCHETRFASPRCVISTPFGLPVEPDVYMTYARSAGVVPAGGASAEGFSRCGASIFTTFHGPAGT